MFATMFLSLIVSMAVGSFVYRGLPDCVLNLTCQDVAGFDALGETCNVYHEFPARCGYYDTAAFDSLNGCCACQCSPSPLYWYQLKVEAPSKENFWLIIFGSAGVGMPLLCLLCCFAGYKCNQTTIVVVDAPAPE